MNPLLLPIALPPPGTPPENALPAAFARYLPLLDSDPVELYAFPPKCQGPHLAALCREAMGPPGRYPFDKLNRWLGFVQGVLAAAGLVDVDEERDATRPLLHAFHEQRPPSWPPP